MQVKTLFDQLKIATLSFYDERESANIAYWLIDVFLEKKKFLGNFIFSNELIKLRSDLVDELRACKLKNYEFKAAEKNFLQLLEREDKALKRGILLIKMGLYEVKNKFPYKEDADQKEKKLKNKFHDLGQSFFSMREQYDNNEFDNSMPIYGNTKSYF